MTFAQYLQNIGIILAQWLPIVGLMYFAVRKGIEHGVAAYEQRAVQTATADPGSFTNRNTLYPKEGPNAYRSDQRTRVSDT